jgi:DNA invertase Pin-like site-specific DNA recombinase
VLAGVALFQMMDVFAGFERIMISHRMHDGLGRAGPKASASAD